MVINPFMAFVIDKVSEDTFYENMFLGVTKELERNHSIKNVVLERHPACLPSEITMWEQINSLKLPDDIRDFYLASNGMRLTWSYVFSQEEILPVGNISILPLNDLLVITDANLQVASDLRPLKNNKMYAHCNSEAKGIGISIVDDNSMVCIISSSNFRVPPCYYLVENCTQCHYLTNTFKKYLLMSIAHLGLPMWQYCFTYQGVPTWVEQMMIMVAPHLEVGRPCRFYEEQILDEKLGYHHHRTYPANKLDASIFKTKRRSSKNNADNMLKYRPKRH